MSERVYPGQEFSPSARTWNSFIDTRDYVNAHKVISREGQTVTGDAGTILVKNISNITFPQYAVVALVGSAIKTETDAGQATFKTSQPFLKIDTVTETNKDQYTYAITLQPIKAEMTGQAVVMGVVPGVVTIGTSTDQYAVPDTSNAGKMISADTGTIKIVWKPDSETGEQLCMLAIGMGAPASTTTSTPAIQYVAVIASGPNEDGSYNAQIAIDGDITNLYPSSNTMTIFPIQTPWNIADQPTYPAGSIVYVTMFKTAVYGY